MSTPAIGELIAWAREQAQWLRRQQFTLVETGRMSELEARRKLRLADGVIAALEAYATENSAAGPVPVANKTALPLDQHVLVHVQFGSTWHQDVIINPRLLIAEPSVRKQWVALVEQRLLAVIRRETSK